MNYEWFVALDTARMKMAWLQAKPGVDDILYRGKEKKTPDDVLFMSAVLINLPELVA